jgi:hypothetical protein
MRNIDDYKNLVELLKQALEFYAERDNYDCKHDMNNVLVSNLDIDGGVQAQFALGKIKEFEEFEKKLLEEYEKLVESTTETDMTPEYFLDLMKRMRKMSDDNDKNV